MLGLRGSTKSRQVVKGPISHIHEGQNNGVDENPMTRILVEAGNGDFCDESPTVTAETYNLTTLDLRATSSDRPNINGRIDQGNDGLADTMIGWKGTEYADFTGPIQ